MASSTATSGPNSGAGALVLQTSVGEFTVGEEIGRGSFATVYIGRRSDGNNGVRLAAVKTVNRDKLNRKLAENLETEIKILKGIRHDHIVGLLDIVKTEKHIHLVMEYCSMGDLSVYIKRKGMVAINDGSGSALQRSQLPAPITDPSLNPIAGAWGGLNEYNLLLNPAMGTDSVTIPSPFKNGRAQIIQALPTLKLADFGFARALPPQSLASTLCGSPLYMAPEILRGDRYDAKADLWSLGAICYEMVTGRPPFKAQNHIDLLRKIDRGEGHIKFPGEDPDASRRSIMVAGGSNSNALSSSPRVHPSHLPVGSLGSSPRFTSPLHQNALPISEDLKDLIRRLLKRNPVERMSFEEFFMHPCVSASHGYTTSAYVTRSPSLLSHEPVGIEIGHGRTRPSSTPSLSTPVGTAAIDIPRPSSAAVQPVVSTFPKSLNSAMPRTSSESLRQMQEAAALGAVRRRSLADHHQQTNHPPPHPQQPQVVYPNSPGAAISNASSPQAFRPHSLQTSHAVPIPASSPQQQAALPSPMSSRGTVAAGAGIAPSSISSSPSSATVVEYGVVGSTAPSPALPSSSLSHVSNAYPHPQTLDPSMRGHGIPQHGVSPTFPSSDPRSYRGPPPSNSLQQQPLPRPSANISSVEPPFPGYNVDAAALFVGLMDGGDEADQTVPMEAVVGGVAGVDISINPPSSTDVQQAGRRSAPQEAGPSDGGNVVAGKGRADLLSPTSPGRVDDALSSLSSLGSLEFSEDGEENDRIVHIVRRTTSGVGTGSSAAPSGTGGPGSGTSSGASAGQGRTSASGGSGGKGGKSSGRREGSESDGLGHRDAVQQRAYQQQQQLEQQRAAAGMTKAAETRNRGVASPVNRNDASGLRSDSVSNSSSSGSGSQRDSSGYGVEGNLGNGGAHPTPIPARPANRASFDEYVVVEKKAVEVNWLADEVVASVSGGSAVSGGAGSDGLYYRGNNYNQRGASPSSGSGTGGIVFGGSPGVVVFGGPGASNGVGGGSPSGTPPSPRMLSGRDNLGKGRVFGSLRESTHNFLLGGPSSNPLPNPMPTPPHQAGSVAGTSPATTPGFVVPPHSPSARASHPTSTVAHAGIHHLTDGNSGHPYPGVSPDALDDPAPLLATLNLCALRGHAINLLADERYRDFVNLTTAGPGGAIIDHFDQPERSSSADGSSVLATGSGVGAQSVGQGSAGGDNYQVAADEALNLYLAALGIYQLGIEAAKAVWSREQARFAALSLSNSASGSHGNIDAAAAAQKNIPVVHVGSLSAAVHWIRERFNDCLERAQEVKSFLGDDLADATGPASVGGGHGRPVEKIIYDRALEIARAAAEVDVSGTDPAAAETGYTHAVFLLEALLYSTVSSLPPLLAAIHASNAAGGPMIASAQADPSAGAGIHLVDADRAVVERFVAGLGSKLAKFKEPREGTAVAAVGGGK
ncbi:Serine/threonine-protein kinase [Phlyctochytrium bullatum]|nr:Serine/threonine-protein kinase [Phlyctochytrium bullatum]